MPSTGYLPRRKGSTRDKPTLSVRIIRRLQVDVAEERNERVADDLERHNAERLAALAEETP